MKNAEKAIIIIGTVVMSFIGSLVGAWAIAYTMATFFPTVFIPTFIQAFVFYFIVRRLLFSDLTSLSLLMLAREDMNEVNVYRNNISNALVELLVPCVLLCQAWILHFFI